MSKTPITPVLPNNSNKPSAEIPPKLAPLPSTVLAFCDGACKSNPGRGGFGTVLILPNGEQIDIYGGEIETTNNRMELLGAISALQHSPPDMPIQIWTDSNYVQKGITEWIAGWRRKKWKAVKNVDLWQQLDQACQNRVISWHWLKGHAGHEGNEYADQLANLGVANLPTPITIKKKRLNPDNHFSQNSPINPDKTAMNPQTIQSKPLAEPMSDNFTDSFFIEEDFADEDAENFEPNNFADNHFSQNDFSNPPFNEPDFSQNGVIENPPQQPVSQFSASQPYSPSTFPQTSQFQNSQGFYIAQDDNLIAQRPEFDGNTQTASVFVPLLPVPKNKNVSNRQLILDTETTGFEATNGDRIIEIGIVELINRKFTGEKLHVYINPNKPMDEEVIRIHGITNEFLADKPVFEQIGQVVYDFMQGAELVAHNAPFDMGFLVAEFNRLGLGDFANQVTVTDSLVIAKQQYAGQRNTLDALVKRLNVGKQDRTFHGALLDAEILAEVYLAMTGGQVSLAIDDSVGGLSGSGEHRRFEMPVTRFVADSSSEQAHLDWIAALKDQHPTLLERWGLAKKEDTEMTVE